MSKGSRLSRLLPKFFRGDGKSKTGQSGSDLKGPFCSIIFLDDTSRQLPYKNNSKGQVLFDQVCDMLDLLEKDYFGLRFVDDSGQAHWLDTNKSISSQLKGCKVPYKFYFGVKFYAADPCKLREEITRYLFFLQVKRDILQGRLPIIFDEAAELCGYALQSELGDFDPRTHTAGYVSEFCFVPNQTEELEAKISGIHRRCIGATPVMAEHRFLEKVQWLEMYGVDLHPVQLLFCDIQIKRPEFDSNDMLNTGESNVEYFLGLTPAGIVVYKHKNKVASYFWPRVTKASHKGKMFMLKVKDKSNEEHLYSFELSTKAACKHLWKCSIEHHAFFSGRSERLAAMEGRWRQQPSVERAPSRRRARRVNSDSRINAEQLYQDQYFHNRQGMITVMGQPEPVRAPRHRSLPELHGRQSPRSVKSAPWESNYDYGLYTSGHDSPSASAGRRDPRHASFISGGSDSESGISQRKRYFPGRKGSDNESDGSASRRRRRERDSDSGSEVSFTMNNKGRKKRNPNVQMDFKNFDSHLLYPFHNKENNQNGSIPSLHSAPAGEMKQRRRRRRSKSPGNSKRPPEELKQHIEFDLIDTEGMTEDQLRDITYTKVETKANLFRVKYSPKFRQKIWASRRKSFGDADRNSAPSRTNLARQDSYNTDPAGTQTRSNGDNRGSGGYQDLYVGSQRGYSNSPYRESRRDELSEVNMGSDWSAPSPASERSAGRSSGVRGYSNPSSSKAYHNPVYLGHQDAVMASGGVSNVDSYDSKRYDDNNFTNAGQHGYSLRQSSQYNSYGYQQNQNQTPLSNTGSRDFNHNRLSYGEQQRLGPSSPMQTRNNENNIIPRPSHQSPGRYNQHYLKTTHQSPYDADVSRADSRLDESRYDQRMNNRAVPPADPLRIESRGYGATLHRQSGGVSYNQGHVMNGASPDQRTLPHQYPSDQVNFRSTHNSVKHPSEYRQSKQNSYDEGNRGVGSSQPGNISRPNYSQQLPPSGQSHNRNPSSGPMHSSGGPNYPSTRSHNYGSPSTSHTPSYNGQPGGQYSGGSTMGYSGPSQSRYNAGMGSQQQQSTRESYSAYGQQSSRSQGQSPPYPRSPGNSRGAGYYPDQTPQRLALGNRLPQRSGIRSDLVTQL